MGVLAARQRRAPEPQPLPETQNRPRAADFCCLVEVAGVEPASKKCRVGTRHRLGPLLKIPGGERTSRLGTLPPGLDRGAEAVPAAHPVPPAGRPKPPVGRFYEPATRRSRLLARCLRELKQRGPVRSYRWQFCLGGLIRGPSVQPPPASFTRFMTCRNRSPPVVKPWKPGPRAVAIQGPPVWAPGRMCATSHSPSRRGATTDRMMLSECRHDPPHRKCLRDFGAFGHREEHPHVPAGEQPGPHEQG